MKLNIMTWNTKLYEYGNRLSENIPIKPIDKDAVAKCNEILYAVKDYVDNNENAIAALQEIPLKSNVTHCFHEFYTLLCEKFPSNEYTILYNVNERVTNQIKMTVVISKKDFIKKDENGINSKNENFCNCFVSFVVNEYKMLAVHQSLKKGGFVTEKLDKLNYNPDIILGDFNAGDYEKEKESDDFQHNRENYRELLNKGYEDICQGDITTTYKTAIDHILISTTMPNKINENRIDDKNNNSDHYPIYCEIEIGETDVKRAVR